jgi:hypothetical protein
VRTPASSFITYLQLRGTPPFYARSRCKIPRDHPPTSSEAGAGKGSLALYTRTGFSRVGVYREHGQLDGRWIDVLIMEKLL